MPVLLLGRCMLPLCKLPSLCTAQRQCTLDQQITNALLSRTDSRVCRGSLSLALKASNQVFIPHGNPELQCQTLDTNVALYTLTASSWRQRKYLRGDLVDCYAEHQATPRCTVAEHN